MSSPSPGQVTRGRIGSRSLGRLAPVVKVAERRLHPSCNPVVMVRAASARTAASDARIRAITNPERSTAWRQTNGRSRATYSDGFQGCRSEARPSLYLGNLLPRNQRAALQPFDNPREPSLEHGLLLFEARQSTAYATKRSLLTCSVLVLTRSTVAMWGLPSPGAIRGFVRGGSG
jgi:hypothetical protein